MPPLSPTTKKNGQGRTHALRLGALAAACILLILWAAGCIGIQIAVVVGPSPEPRPIAHRGKLATVHQEPTVRPTSTRHPVTIEQPTATSTREPRIPAQSPPDRIVIPSINLDAPVVPVGWSTRERDGRWFSEWQTASYAAGFHKGSALPGHVGNTVISGHHNIKGKVFEHLVELKPGDLVILYADGRPYRYRVQDKFIVKEVGVSLAQRRQNAQWIAPTRDERLTLVTCWPPDGNTYRVIVVAKPIME
ncbi:MAG TPA: sortase [Caldilineae bacterium]|nr:sortase [Caldilineae bacterium]